MAKLALLFLCSFGAFAQTVPTPESVLGHKPGDDFYLANYDESREYFRKLAATSDRVKLINVGKTTRGLDWEIAVISSPRNLAQLDKYKDISHRLAMGRGLDDASAKALARGGESHCSHRWRHALQRSGRRATLHSARLQTDNREGRSRSRRHPRQRDPDALAHIEPRRAE